MSKHLPSVFAMLLSLYVATAAIYCLRPERSALVPKWMRPSPYTNLYFSEGPWCFAGGSEWSCTMAREMIPTDPSPILEKNGQLTCPLSARVSFIGHNFRWAICVRVA
jgi:hypothetical protein